MSLGIHSEVDANEAESFQDESLIKARNAKTTVEQVGKQREQLNPEAPPAKP